MTSHPPRERFKFPRARRLSGRIAFARIFGARRSAANRLIVVYAAANDLAYCRLGLSVGRKLGGAVQRNRVKRLLREAFRLEQRQLPVGFDFVVIPRTAAGATLDDYRSALKSTAARAIARGDGARHDRSETLK